MPHLDDENLLPTLIQTVDTVHRVGSAGFHRTDPLRSPRKRRFSGGGRLCHRTSPMEANLYGDKVIEMDEDMMNMIADAYAQAPYMAEFAGL